MTTNDKNDNSKDKNISKQENQQNRPSRDLTRKTSELYQGIPSDIPKK